MQLAWRRHWMGCSVVPELANAFQERLRSWSASPRRRRCDGTQGRSLPGVDDAREIGPAGDGYELTDFELRVILTCSP